MYEETTIEIVFGGRSATTGILPNGTILRKRYKIKRKIAQGGFGITYLATDIQLSGGDVAIKEFYMSSHCGRNTKSLSVTVSDIGDNQQVFADYKAKFIKEAKNIFQFQDTPGIVKVLDIFEENNTAYYVMNYIQGQSLQEYIEKKGKLPLNDASIIIRDLCGILRFIHNKNCLHLDIKPSNIMIENNGRLVLIDFGVSKHYNSVSGIQTTKTPVAHSPGYAPLEQYRNEVTGFTPATDIYSVGAVFYFLLCGKRPPEASVDLSLNFSGTTVSKKIQRDISKLMAPNRTLRPQNVDDVLKLLDDAPSNTTTSNSKESTFNFQGTIDNNKEQEIIPTHWLWLIVIGGVVAFFIFAALSSN